MCFHSNALSKQAAVIVWFSALLLPVLVQAADLSNGMMIAVPTPNGKAPALDGTDAGWDLSAAEPVWYSNQLAKELHASLALNYDDTNLYVYARLSLPNRKLINTNGPADPYWQGDLLMFRFASDPTLPRPLNMQTPAMRDSDRICHLAMWENTLDGKTYLSIHYGGFHGGGKGTVFNPPNSKVSVVEGKNEYVIEARIPWAALNAPGGKNPFAPGQTSSGIFELHWLSPTFFYATTAVYAANPGDFAFLSWGSWGQIQFSDAGNLKPRHQTMEGALSHAAAVPRGVPVEVKVPADGKISVNIFGEHGEVLRELTGGESVKAGKFTVYWDGKDQWGFALPPGDYKWGAYFSKGLQARYVGFVGSSGNPPYPTLDGKGGWGGDHGVPMAAAADASGLYLGFFGCEAQRQIVKLDYAGNTIWRKTPFLKGGFPTLYALTSNGKYLLGAYTGEHPVLCRMNAATGIMVLYGTELGEGASVPIAAGNTPIAAPPNSLPAENGLNKSGTAPECMGLAATDKEVFASIYSQNLIQVMDIESGKPTRTLTCLAPRGLALDAAGNLYAVSCGVNLPAQVVRFKGVHGEATPVVTSGLVAPVGVAIDPNGGINVTDQGPSQQVKTFDADGKLLRTLGKEGGRSWAGTYDNTSYLAPTGIAADPHGGLVVAEASIPKIFDRIEAASGKTLTRWFGWPGYGVSNIGDSDDPMTSYYPFEPEGFARAHVPAEGQSGYPDAYWVPAKAQPNVNTTYGYQMLPFVSRLENDRKYFIDDGNPHAVCLVDGDNLLPVNYLDVRNPKDRRTPEVTSTIISMWADRDGDHQSKPDEITLVAGADGKPLPTIPQRANSIWIDSKGNAYLPTQGNSILKIPAQGFEKSGAIKWNAEKATLVVRPVIPSMLERLSCGPRNGMAGVRVDAHHNVYTCLTMTVPALTPPLAEKISKAYPDLPQSQWCVYADADIARRMHEGLGHTAESNAVKFAKFAPNGKMLWIAGRKATAAPAPGEMYHFWSLAGLVDDKYIAGSSEWGPIYFYTSDGYYVDALMNDPSALTPPGPYTFGSENFAGRIETYDKLGKVYAYDQGGIYAVDGFTKDLKVEGERRLSGTVTLDKTYEVATSAVAQSLQIVPVKGDLSKTETWNAAPLVTLSRANLPLATAQVGYDDVNLYERIHVQDDTPLQNGADDLGVVFKGGDAVGLDLGPAGTRDKPASGDVRLLAAIVHGKPHLLGMKPVSTHARQRLTYTTPASGTKTFDFVGEVPGGAAALTPDADGKGYTALLTIPRSFLEFALTPKTPLKGDLEVLLSGTGQRGLQAVSRNWLYSGGHVQTTMVDDIPTEAWLYPQFWGDINVR